MLLRYAILLTALAAPALAQPADPAVAIRSALTGWMADFNARRTSDVCNLFAPDLRFDASGMPERGYREMCAQLRRVLTDPARRYAYALEIKEILVSGDLAVVRLGWTLTLTRPGAAKTVSKETAMDVFRQQPDGSWKIIRFIVF